jgi:hypothetical protein
VAKLSFAIDQNAEKDRQANVGLSIERKEFFLNFFLSGQRSRVGTVSTQTQSVVYRPTPSAPSRRRGRTSRRRCRRNCIRTPPVCTVGLFPMRSRPASTAASITPKVMMARADARVRGHRQYLGTQLASRRRRARAEQRPARYQQQRQPLGLFLRYARRRRSVSSVAGLSAADAAWIDRALHEPVTATHARSIPYHARADDDEDGARAEAVHGAFPIARDDSERIRNSTGNTVDVLSNDADSTAMR